MCLSMIYKHLSVICWHRSFVSSWYLTGSVNPDSTTCQNLLVSLLQHWLYLFMKKQKQKEVKAEALSGPDMGLSIVVAINADEEWLREKVVKKLGKSRPDISLYLTHAPAEGSLVYKDLSDWITNGRYFTGDASTICQAIQNGKPGYVFLVDKENESVLGHAISFFLANKKQFKGLGVLHGELDTKKEKVKTAFTDRIYNSLYNFAGQLITPTAQKDFTLPFQYVSNTVFAEVFTEQTNTSALLSARAAYLEAASDSIALTAKEAASRKRSWKALVQNAFRSRFLWFIQDPFLHKTGLGQFSFAVFSIIALISMLVLSQQYGMTWDEKRHNDYSKTSLAYFESFGEDSTCLSETLPTQEFRYYGEHFNVIAAFLYTHVLSIGEYETRHLLNAFYGFLAMLFAALLAKEIGSWRAGFFAFVAIYFSPVFFGHSMNNPTDIPFATGFAMALYYLLKIFKSLPAPKFSHVFMAAVGIGIAVGSRVGGVLLYAYAALFMSIHFLQHIKQNGFKYFLAYVKIFVSLIVVGHLLSISLWPFGQQEIFSSWYEALKKSTEGAFFTYNHELFEGVRMYMAKVPWYYLPKFILINTPLVVLVGLAMMLVLLFVIKRLYKHSMLVYFTLFALLFPIVYAEYQSMYYYNGWRHYLFIYPPLIVLSALGWESLIRVLKNNKLTWVVIVVMVVLISLPAGWLISNHPNAAVYFNELTGGTKGAYGQYELDYYSNSCREAGEWLAKQEPNKKLLVAINNEPQTAAYYAQKINPNMEFKWVREYEEQRPFWDYAIFTSRTYSQRELLNGAFPPKGTVHVVEVDGAPIAAVVKRENYAMPLGYKALDAKLNDSAIYYFTQATVFDPNDEEAWRMLGEAYTNKQSNDTAIQMLNKSIALSPENYSAYNQLGLVYMNNLKDNGKAIEAFEKSTEIKFNFAEGYYYAASCYMMMREYNKAINLLENAIKRGGNGIPEVYYNLGACYLTLGMNKKAEENFILCLTLSPNLAMGYRALAEAFQKQGKMNEAQQCMQKYRELGGQ